MHKNSKEITQYSQTNKHHEQIDKIIMELIQTEKSYIQVSKDKR